MSDWISDVCASDLKAAYNTTDSVVCPEAVIQVFDTNAWEVHKSEWRDIVGTADFNRNCVVTEVAFVWRKVSHHASQLVLKLADWHFSRSEESRAGTEYVSN